MCWDVPEVASPCAVTFRDALERQAQLTKPPGSLGLLEELAVRLAAMQGRVRPALDQVTISLFAADHGVADEGVSAFPQSVTRKMLRNFICGGAAISVLARRIGAGLEVVDVGVIEHENESPDNADIVSARAGNGTANFTLRPAMTDEQLVRALTAGSEAVARARMAGAQLFIGGEMGIANTTSASALACALLHADPRVLTGPGTGLNAERVRHKRTVIEAGLMRHDGHGGNPLEILRCLGGFEIAALSAAYLHAASSSIPVLVDGFIAGVAALLAVRLQPACADWLFFAHRSAEPGHIVVLEALQARPILDMDMRLGEGSGAALAVPLLRSACAIHNDMATFSEAGISSA
ncbi:nicotinate-nucleotide--dimethylbenzimidazole phosphoribosyltransferase [Candidatus Methylospira mobilis]|uniref:Nicotinate-nucleotide--dimethylbenzimidazole phosphoribosyltransferase n=1 Tax=Candidatus Methylospira mobilis TaxID=1808979 RepID=A0A5Q0BGI0_9GAMM|nr:nicotinate-nucleotide--dimethylbenzimidazole phosphoribosyltransferase [Candidatus Methylospira mobilis]QFY42910.1 nicotinate-nucleotide--dimethylbenzimidazole phosphoribosyltransferase [Candidatus Methylospira mobilis]WNV03849.1 nicotinate-nucleotide--dimethylbenzimidazole phosphoribosyltransferase [Candidatus Methylospira mobilis]